MRNPADRFGRRRYDRDHQAGVLAHEISHIRNRGLRLMMPADVMSPLRRRRSLPIWMQSTIVCISFGSEPCATC